MEGLVEVLVDKKKLLKSISKPLLYPLAFAVVAWEEAFYKPVKKLSEYIEKNKVVHIISDKIRNAHPLVATGLLLSCTLPLLPFKLAGVYFIGHGYKALGIATFGAAKVIGSAISLHMFNLTEPAMRKNAYINKGLNWVFDKKDKLKKYLDESVVYQNIKNMVHELKQSVKEKIGPSVQNLKKMVKEKIQYIFPKKANKSIPIDEPVMNRINHRVNSFYDTDVVEIKPKHDHKVEEIPSNGLNEILAEQKKIEISKKSATLRP